MEEKTKEWIQLLKKETLGITFFEGIIQLLEEWEIEKDFDLLEQICNDLEQLVISQDFDGLNEQIETVYHFGKFLYWVSESIIYSSQESNKIHLLCINLYVRVADYFESIGCVGEAFDALVLSIDPNYEKALSEDFKVEFKLDHFVEGIEYGFERSREILIYYSSIYYRVSAIVDHNLYEAKNHSLLVNDYTDIDMPNSLDIEYYCNLSVVHFNLKNNESLSLITILFIKFLQMKLSDQQRFNIIENLLVYQLRIR